MTVAHRNLHRCLEAAMQLEVMRLAMLYKVTCRDGFTLGFSTHDRDITIGGVTYEALAAVNASAMRSEAGGSSDSMEVAGAVTSNCLTERDLRAGRYDGAVLEVRICDWNDLTTPPAKVFRGVLGEVKIDSDMYSADTRSLMRMFQQQIGELYSPGCRVFDFGDARCKVDTSGNAVGGQPITSEGTVLSVESVVVLRLDDIVEDAGFYTYGKIRGTSGDNNGVVREVKLHSESDEADTADVTSSPTTLAELIWRRPTNYTASAGLDFDIPAGSWDEAVLLLHTTWSAVDADAGTDTLALQLPSGGANDETLRAVSLAGEYDDVALFGSAAMVALNGAAGGTLTVGLRHTSQSESGAPWFHIDVNSATLILTGAAAGTTNRLVLRERFPFAVSVGDTFTVVAGCNRLASTCSLKYDNIVNYRGEPHLPGVDRLLRVGRSPQ